MIVRNLLLDLPLSVAHWTMKNLQRRTNRTPVNETKNLYTSIQYYSSAQHLTTWDMFMLVFLFATKCFAKKNHKELSHLARTKHRVASTQRWDPGEIATIPISGFAKALRISSSLGTKHHSNQNEKKSKSNLFFGLKEFDWNCSRLPQLPHHSHQL